MENSLTKVCNINRDDWDMNILVVLWAYSTTCKNFTVHKPFKLVYGKEVVLPMDFIVSILRVDTYIGMDDTGEIEERFSQLLQLEEDGFIIGFHQQV